MSVACMTLDRRVAEKRRSVRFTATLPVLLHHAGRRYPATVANIGEGGVMVSCNLSCAVGEPIVIHCGATEALAKVAWSRDGLVGLTFARSLLKSEVAGHLNRSAALADRRSTRLRAVPS